MLEGEREKGVSCGLHVMSRMLIYCRLELPNSRILILHSSSSRHNNNRREDEGSERSKRKMVNTAAAVENAYSSLCLGSPQRNDCGGAGAAVMEICPRLVTFSVSY